MEQDGGLFCALDLLSFGLKRSSVNSTLPVTSNTHDLLKNMVRVSKDDQGQEKTS